MHSSLLTRNVWEFALKRFDDRYRVSQAAAALMGFALPFCCYDQGLPLRLVVIVAHVRAAVALSTDLSQVVDSVTPVVLPLVHGVMEIS